MYASWGARGRLKFGELGRVGRVGAMDVGYEHISWPRNASIHLRNIEFYVSQRCFQII